MKALINKQVKYGERIYIFRKGKEVKNVPNELKQVFENAGYIEKSKEPIKVEKKQTPKLKTKVNKFDLPDLNVVNKQEHKIEEEGFFSKFRKEEE